jgi:uncharacterized pyridoxal phosphate-containing UPF0001 family protein
MSDPSNDRLRNNLAAIRGRMAEACRRAGRQPGDVTLVGVTKYVSAERAAELVEAGCHDVAESRPQLLWAKADALASLAAAPRWHLVGHLQRNKVRRTIPLMSLLHSLDSRRLLDTLDAAMFLAEERAMGNERVRAVALDLEAKAQNLAVALTPHPAGGGVGEGVAFMFTTAALKAAIEPVSLADPRPIYLRERT